MSVFIDERLDGVDSGMQGTTQQTLPEESPCSVRVMRYNSNNVPF
jgi:hypothetical protein